MGIEPALWRGARERQPRPFLRDNVYQDKNLQRKPTHRTIPNHLTSALDCVRTCARVAARVCPRACRALTACAQIWRAVWKPAFWNKASGAGRVEYALAANNKPAPPSGFPAVSCKRVLRGLEHAKHPPRDIVIDIVYDADEGTLSFAMTYRTRCEGFMSLQKTVHEPMRRAVVDFPKGAKMRPWVHLCNVGDVIRVGLQPAASDAQDYFAETSSSSLHRACEMR